MGIKFPVFIIALDDKSILKHDSTNMLDYYEQPDIKDGLYKGWDCNGHPFQVLWDEQSRRPYLKSYESINPRIEELREALLDYTNTYLPGFNIPETIRDPVEIYSHVEKELAERKRSQGVRGCLISLLKFFRS